MSGRRLTRSVSSKTAEEDHDVFKITSDDEKQSEVSDLDDFRSVAMDGLNFDGLILQDEEETTPEVRITMPSTQRNLNIVLTSIGGQEHNMPEVPPHVPLPRIAYRKYYSEVSSKYPERGQGVRDAINNFELSKQQYESGWRVNERLSELRSVSYHYGIAVVKHDDSSVQKWICLADDVCRTQAKNMENWYSHKNYTNAGRVHMRTKHGIESEKTRLEEDRKEVRDETYAYLTQSNLYNSHPTRFCLLLFTLYIILNCIPFNNCCKPVTRMFFALVCVLAMPENVSVKRVMHHMTEIYVYVLEQTKSRYRRLNAKTWIPIMSLNMDLWTSKKTHRKFFGVRVFYVQNFKLMTELLAVREFNPSSEVKMSQTKQAELLEKWTVAVLLDFGLTVADFYSATTDAGSDVKCTIMKKLGLKWEWCPPHQLSCGVKGALVKVNRKGAPVEKFEIQILLEKMKASVRKIKEISKVGTLFHELQKSANTKKAIKAFKSHRFLGVYQMLKRYLEVWGNAKAFHLKVDEKHFPLEGTYEKFHQLCSVLHPLSVITTELQTRTHPMGWSYVVQMCDMRHDGVLNLDTPLEKFDKEEPYPGSVEDDVHETRKRLISGIDTRFFVPRYVDLTSSLLFDCQVYMHPAFKKIDIYTPMLEMVMRDHAVKHGKCHPTLDEVLEQVKMVEEKVEEEIIQLAELVCERQQEKSKIPAKSRPTSGKKISKLLEKHIKKSATTTSASSTTVTRAVTVAVRKELKMWKETTWNCDNPEDPLEAWEEIAPTLPLLSYVAEVIFGVATSACVMESDFGVGELFLTANRSSLSPETVEMGLFIMRTPLADIDIVQVPEIVGDKDLHLYRPKHPLVSLGLTSGTSEETEKDESTALEVQEQEEIDGETFDI